MSGRITLNLPRGTDFHLDVSFEIPDEGITVLFGPSGCGKTTVLRCTAGLERAAGRVVVADRVWQDDAQNIFVPAWERRLGYVFQEASLFEHLNVEGNLRFGLRHKDARGGLARFSEAVELLGIGHLLKRRVQLLSGGERQRVAIARALLMTPDLILMDEPLAALDWNRKQEILPWLERLRDELSVPMLYVTHSADEMTRLADRVICFERGSIVAEGPLEDVLLERWPGQGEQGASAVVSGVVTERSSRWHTVSVRTQGAVFEVADAGLGVGEAVRLRIMARDVSVALTESKDSSIRNILPAVVAAMRGIDADSHVLLTLEAGGCRMLSRVTRRSVEELGIGVGMRLYAQVKAAAIIV